MLKGLRVLLLNIQGSGVGEYRFWMPARALQRAGMQVTYFPEGSESIFKDDGSLLNWFERNARNHDVMHLGYTVEAELIRWLMAVRGFANLPMITDLDDDFMNVPPDNYAFGEYHTTSDVRKIVRMHLRVSDAATMSTTPLHAVVGHECRHSIVLPNCNEAAMWEHPQDPRRAEDKSIRVLFAGNMGRYADLNTVRDVLEGAMRKYDGTDGKPHMRLFFLCCLPDWANQWMQSKTDPLANRCFYLRQCNVSIYRPLLRWISPDILISPLVANKFNESKSQIKAYDAAMTGAAFLCTDALPYADVPNDAAVKAATPYEWQESLCALVEDAALRQKLSSRLKTWALDSWEIDNHIQRWIDLYEEVYARGPIRDLSEIVRPGGPPVAVPGRP